MPFRIEEIDHWQDGKRHSRLSEPLPDGCLLLDRNTGKFGPVSECDRSLPANAIRDIADLRVIQIVHLVSAVEMEIHVDVIVLRQLKNAGG